jgi:hypothetical protein
MFNFSGWCFGTWLLFFHILGIHNPIWRTHIFQMGYTTNQLWFMFFFKPDNGWSNSYLRVTSYHCQPCLFISTHGVRKDPKQIFKMVFQSFLSFSLWFSRWVFPFRGDAHGPLSLPQFWRCCLSSRSGTGVKGEDVMWFSDLLEDFGYFGWFWIIENGDSALLNHPNLAND